MRVALLADFVEEGWPSMDLVADMLRVHLAALPEPELQIEMLRPAMQRRFGRGRAGAAWTLDRLLNRLVEYPRFLRRQRLRFDLFHVVDHSYSQLIHELPAARTVVTCHDLDTFRCLWESGGGRGPIFRAMTRRILTGLQRAAHVCCDSEATRDEILERRLLPAGRLTVVRLGLRPEFAVTPDPAGTLRISELIDAGNASSIGSTVDLLHVGSTSARKRIDVLLETFARVRREIEPRARLLRVGGALTPAQQAFAQKLQLPSGSVLTLPFLSPTELAAVYRHAALTLLPSDAEGFGLPVIEALACGSPLLASDLPVLREVGGSAAEYAPVANVEAWVARIRELLAERRAAPAAWEARRTRCREQGRRFSWESTARQTMEIYRRVWSAAAKSTDSPPQTLAG